MDIRKNKLRYLLLLFVFLLITAEIGLRTYFGFCHAVLMKSDPDFEYINLANQHTYRLRKQYIYNEYSMRSTPVDSSCIHILGFGDSIINNGDHDDLATSILSTRLSELYKQKVQFLNISAGSWGPDNSFAYLKKYGTFQAKKIYLFVSSHDAYDNMTFEKIVGVSKAHPDKQYISAIYELFDRYIIPKLTFKKQIQASVVDHIPEGVPFNSGFKSFNDYAKTHHLSFILFLHASVPELKEGKYNSLGQEIIAFANRNHITLIQDLRLMTSDDYVDQLHINAKGQQKIAAAVLAQYRK